MPSALVCLVFFLTGIIAAAPAFAQSGRPAPSLSSLPPSQPTPSAVPTLKANAQLVVVNVVVTDSKQNPIHNLKAADFTVTENNASQQLTGFEEHVTLPPAQAAKVPPMPHLPPGIFTNFTPAPPNSAVNMLLLDALNTQMKDQSYMRDQLREYLKNTPQGTRIAIFGLNNHLIMLQGFTSDLALLKAAVEKSSPTTSGSLAASGDSVGSGNGLSVTGQISGASADGGDMGQVIASLGQVLAVQAAQDTQDRVKTTLDAMNQLAHYLAGIPGRKNLVWFSGSFPLNVMPTGGPHAFEVVANSEDEYRETVSLLARAQVAVYPINARGISTNAASISDDPTMNARGVISANNRTFGDTANENSTMYQMAADTGGHAFINTNGLSQAVGQAIESGSNYYTLSYTPTDSRRNGEFHKIQIKLAQQGLTLTYRNGYYADSDKFNRKPGGLDVNLPNVANANWPDKGGGEASGSLARVMMRGGPTPAEILLKLQILPASAADENAVAKGNIANPNPAAKVKLKGPFRRYAIDIAADPRDIRVTKTSDGHYEFSTEVLTYVYDANGIVVNSAAQKAHGILTPSTYANMLHTGLPFHQEISVPISGEFFLRTSVHDLATDRYGAVEIPIASVAKLAPLAAAVR